MNHFRQLLDPAAVIDPGRQQARASALLPGAVAASQLRPWDRGQPWPGPGRCLVVVVAPYSRYDLALLDILDEMLATASSPTPVYVGNLQAYATRGELAQQFPALGEVHQTPVVAVCEGGSVTAADWGRAGRDLAARELGLPADELTRRVVAAARPSGSPGQPAPAAP